MFKIIYERKKYWEKRPADSKLLFRVLFLRDHWYHLFVGTSYRLFPKFQDGMLYKIDIISFYNVQILWFFTIFVLTFVSSHDMLVMLGRLSKPLVFLCPSTTFPRLLSSFTWKRLEIQKLLVICFLDAFFTP